MSPTGLTLKVLIILSSINALFAWLMLIFTFEQEGVNHPDFPYIVLYFFSSLVFIITAFSLFDPNNINLPTVFINVIFGLILLITWKSAYTLIEDDAKFIQTNPYLFIALTHIFVILQLITSITQLLKR